MSWSKYILSILFFAVVVALGISADLSKFNQMVYPARQVSLFSLQGGGNGVYRMEFLGEKIRMEYPADLTKNLLTMKAVVGGEEYSANVIHNLKSNSGEVFDKGYPYVRREGEKIVSELTARAGEIVRSLRAWLPVDRTEGR